MGVWINLSLNQLTINSLLCSYSLNQVMLTHDPKAQTYGCRFQDLQIEGFLV